MSKLSEQIREAQRTLLKLRKVDVKAARGGQGQSLTYPCRVNEADYLRWSKANDSRRD